MQLSDFLVAWRTIALPDREVIDALVHPTHAAPSPALTAVLQEWPGTYYWSDEPEGRHVVLTRALRRRRERWGLHVALFLATFYTITFAGAVLANGIPYTGLLVFFTSGYPGYPGFLAAWRTGLPFSLPLLAILVCHELGHYVVARRYQLDVSPPYFIPVPMFPTLIGTLGAFIRLRTVLSDRRQLFDVGIAGPLAGFVVALPILALGLLVSGSDPAAAHAGVRGLTVYFTPDQATPLGDSLVTLFLRSLLVGGATAVRVHLIGFAGWLGMFVTMLNLLPISQLDGGHILYAALPRWQRRIALAFWVGIILLGRLWSGWYLWGALVLLLSRGRLAHPAVLDAQRPLPASRRALAWAALVLFLITFAPVPFRFA
ncbi:MAG TPA: site-2 protease family protein [Gemmatimonadales bacterium]|nr:site-2 protease family protein [Gemmatimonadales bacterium]